MNRAFKQRLVKALTSKYSVILSGSATAYGVYLIIQSSNAGSSYEADFDLDGKTYIVTGANSGIGFATANELAAKRARVIMACRNKEECVRSRREIVLTHRNKKVYCRKLDLEDFDSVRDFATKLSNGKTAIDRIDGIIHNAATWERERLINKDGIEKMLATNYLGSFLLTGLLMDKLIEQSKLHPVKIVFLNTDLIEKKCNLDFADFNLEEKIRKGIRKSVYNELFAYKMSKLAQATFAKELAERLKDTNIKVLVTDPGKTSTKLDYKLSYNSFFLSRWIMELFNLFLVRKPSAAIKPIMYAIGDEETENLSGAWIDRKREIREQWPNTETIDDPIIRQTLWATSEAWTKFKEHYRQMNETLQVKGQEVAGAIQEPEKKSKSWLGFW